MGLRTSRARFRVGREVTYYPTDAEAATGNGDAGDAWYATITKVNADDTVNLNVKEADGGIVAVTDIPRGIRKGEFDFAVRGGVR
jgi:hypothetical protein